MQQPPTPEGPRDPQQPPPTPPVQPPYGWKIAYLFLVLTLLGILGLNVMIPAPSSLDSAACAVRDPYGCAAVNYRAYLLIGTIATGVIAGALFLIAGALFLIRERTKGSLRTLLKSWEFRVSVLALCGIVLCETAYLAARILLPRTADGVSVTVVQCATVQPAQPYTDFACQGTTIFHRTFTDEATVSAVHATLLDGLYEVNPWFNNINCNGGDLCAPRRIYSFDLLWHGHVVQSYVTSNSPLIWSVSTLGLELLATDGSTTRLELGAPAGPTTWQDLVRLTGMPVAPNGVP